MKKVFSILSVLMLAVVLISTVAAGKKSVNLYLVGDGTVAEHAVEDVARGWGQALPTYLQDNAFVQNYAKSGGSTKSFLLGGEWDNVLSQLQRGDVLLLQFGHNDEQASDPKLYSSVADFEFNLQEMLKQAKKKRAKVILCTPLARRIFNDHLGKLADTHGAYSEAVRRVAEATNTPLVDLCAITMDWLNTADRDVTLTCYADNVYLTETGATEVARMVAEEINKQGIKCLIPYLKFAE